MQHKYIRMIQRKTPNKNKHSNRRFHYTKKKGKWKPKKGFVSHEDADEFIAHHKLKDYVSYKCPHCNFWHIGRNMT